MSVECAVTILNLGYRRNKEITYMHLKISSSKRECNIKTVRTGKFLVIYLFPKDKNINLNIGSKGIYKKN